MTQKTEKQLRQLAEIVDDFFCYDLTEAGFNLIIKGLIESEKLTDAEKCTLVIQFSKELISADSVIDKILN